MTDIFDSKFSWQTQEHKLLIPLQNIRPAVRVRKEEKTTLDQQTTEGYVFGEIFEALAEINYDIAPQSLIDLILAGASWEEITYTNRGVQTNLFMIFDGNNVTVDVQRQSDMRPLKYYTIPVRLRKVDGSAFGNDFFEAM